MRDRRCPATVCRRSPAKPECLTPLQAGNPSRERARLRRTVRRSTRLAPPPCAGSEAFRCAGLCLSRAPPRGSPKDRRIPLPRRLYTLLVLLALLLAACGGSPAAAPVDTPAAADGGTTPTVAGTSAATELPDSTAAAPATTAAPTGATTPTIAAPATADPAAGTAGPVAATASPDAATAEATTAASAGGGFPLTYPDAGGAKVTLERMPQRIVSIFPLNSDTVFAIGAGDQVVAVDDFTTYPEEAAEKPKVGGDNFKFDIERIVALKPDLVLSGAGAEQVLDEPLRDAGIRVINTGFPGSLQATYQHMRDLGRITGHPAEAAELARKLERSVQQVRRRARGVERPRVYLETDASVPTKPYTVTKGTIADELIAAAGGTNVFRDAKTQFGQVSTEAIVKANPQVIVLSDVEGYVGPKFQNATTVAEVKRRKGYSGLDAVRTGRVAPVGNEELITPGPRLATALRELAVAIHPEIFGER